MANLEIIRDLCKRQKMTIRELAQRIGRDESTIQSAMHRGSTNTVTIEAIARELAVSPGVFFDGFTPVESSQLRARVEHLQNILEEKEKQMDYLREILKEKERLIEVLSKK